MMSPSNDLHNRWQKWFTFIVLFILIINFTSDLPAAIIGINPPTLLLTNDRIDALPLEQRADWKKYLKHSEEQRIKDRDSFQTEIKKYSIHTRFAPAYMSPKTENAFLKESASWYGTTAAQRIADIILSFQSPSGGWGKNLDFKEHPRNAGEFFMPYSRSQYRKQSAENTYPPSYGGTFDNDATVTQLRFLAKVITALGVDHAGDYYSSFLRGINYILEAQYPNGGWPQSWPLEGSYHDAITYNDNAMTDVLLLLFDIVQTKDEFTFVPIKQRNLAAISLKRGIQCILATQIVVNGHRTVWCQQHDALTLKPISARSYETPSQVSNESASIMLFLMKLPDPDQAIVTAVHAAAAWFEKTKIRNAAFKDTSSGNRHFISAPGQGLLWARFYEIGTDRPLFGDPEDPNRSIHDNIEDLSKKCRHSYAWYSTRSQNALKCYILWSKKHPLKN